MQSIEVAKTVGGELVLSPRNKTLFSCDHSHVFHMPNSEAGRPYKLITVVTHDPHIYSFELVAALRYCAIARRVGACECVRAWAMLEELQRVG